MLIIHKYGPLIIPVWTFIIYIVHIDPLLNSDIGQLYVTTGLAFSRTVHKCGESGKAWFKMTKNCVLIRKLHSNT